MSIKAETISQYDGFGNHRQQYSSEHHRSCGFAKSAFGMSGSTKIYEWFTETNLQNTWPEESLDFIIHWTSGLGVSTGTSGNSDNQGAYAMDDEGSIYWSEDGTSTFELVLPFPNSSHFGTGTESGMIIDPKGRLLYAGTRKLGLWDPTVDKTTHSVDVTNGSKTVTQTSGDGFTADMGTNDNIIIFFVGGDKYYERIKTYTSSTVVELFSAVSFATGSYSAHVLVQATDGWKDFGADMTSIDSDGDDARIPTENYEDTVLFGRNNLIITLNVTTDTLTSHSSPSFEMPDGYDIVEIHRGANGILMGWNFNHKGILTLWDNYSDRAIAPWIELPDKLVSMCKYSGGWIIITGKAIYYTNGYSLQQLSEEGFLDTHISPMSARKIPQTSVTVDDDLYFLTDFSTSGKRRAGLHKMNLKTKIVEYIPREDMDQRTDSLYSLSYYAGAGLGRLFVGASDSIGYVSTNTEPLVATFVSNPVGKGQGKKHAEAVKLDLGIEPSYSTGDSPFSFEAIVKICPLGKQIYNTGVVKTTQIETDEIIVDETVYETAEVGDEIEFVDGNNAGYSRNITSISGGGTSTATYTLDRDLPALCSTSDYFFRTKFELVQAKTFTNVTEIDPDLLYYNIENKHKGIKYLIKVEIEDSTVPIEIRPITFVYDDLGTI